MRTTIKQGALYLTGASAIFIGVGYLTNIILGKFLGPGDYGNYGVIVSLISVVNIIQTSGLTQSVSKYVSQDEQLAPEIMKSAFTLQFIATGIVTALFFFLAPSMAFLLNDASLTPYLQLAAASFPLYGIYALLIDYHNGRQYFKKQALLTSLYSLLKAIGVIGIGYFFHLKGILWGFIIAPILSILIGFYYPKSVRFHFPYRKLIFFSLPLIGYILFSTLLQSIDLYFVKSLLADQNAGFYTASQNIARILYFGTAALSSVLLPSISYTVQQHLYTKTKKTIEQALRLLLLVLAPLIALVAATSKEVLLIVYSATYTPGSEALMLLILSFGFFAIFTLLCTILIAGGKPHIPLLFALIGFVLNALFCSLLIPQLSLMGAALASALSTFLVMGLAGGAVYHRWKTLLRLRSAITIVFSATFVFFLAKTISFEIFLLPILYVALLSLYILLLILLKELTDEDFKSVMRIH